MDESSDNGIKAGKEGKAGTVFNAQDIMRMLPHRYPMLLVDRVIECDNKSRIVAIKNVTVNEPFFAGHFPGLPVMPGVLQLEAMAQTAGILLNCVADVSGRIPYFMTIDKAKFRRLVVPGDQMRMEVEFLRMRKRTAFFKAQTFVDGVLVSEAEMMCMITEEKVGQ